MKTLVTTHLTLGGLKDFYFGENNEYSIKMYDNPKFEKSYSTVEEFLREFTPTKPSEKLMNRISEEFQKGGKITYKPIGYKANQTFYFSNTLEWVKKNLDIISVYKIESLVGMPHSTLDKAVKGVRGLPKKWAGPLEEFVKERMGLGKNEKNNSKD